MTTSNHPLAQRIITKLEGFNKRLEARLERNHELLVKMRAEEDFGTSMRYFKAFFSSK
jgi:hypothetical protein